MHAFHRHNSVDLRISEDSRMRIAHAAVENRAAEAAAVAGWSRFPVSTVHHKFTYWATG